MGNIFGNRMEQAIRQNNLKKMTACLMNNPALVCTGWFYEAKQLHTEVYTSRECTTVKIKEGSFKLSCYYLAYLGSAISLDDWRSIQGAYEVVKVENQYVWKNCVSDVLEGTNQRQLDILSLLKSLVPSDVAQVICDYVVLIKVIPPLTETKYLRSQLKKAVEIPSKIIRGLDMVKFRNLNVAAWCVANGLILSEVQMRKILTLQQNLPSTYTRDLWFLEDVFDIEIENGWPVNPNLQLA